MGSKDSLKHFLRFLACFGVVAIAVFSVNSIVASITAPEEFPHSPLLDPTNIKGNPDGKPTPKLAPEDTFVMPKLKRSSIDSNVLLTLSEPTRLVTAVQGGGIAIYDMETEALLKQVEGWLNSNVTALAASPDETTIYVGLNTGIVLTIDVASGEVTNSAQVGSVDSGVASANEAVRSMAVSGDGSKISVAFQRTVSLWSLPNWTLLHSGTNDWHNIEQVVFDSYENFVIAVAFNEVQKLNVSSGEFTLIDTLFGDANFSTLSNDGSKFVTFSPYEGLFQVVKSQTGDVMAEFPAVPGPNLLAVLSPDGTKLATWEKNSYLRVRDLQTNTTLLDRQGLANSYKPMIFTNDNEILVTRNEDGSLRMLNVIADLHLGNIESAHKEPQMVAITPDGSKVIHGYCDGTIAVLESLTGRLLMTLGQDNSTDRIHGERAFHSLVVSNDGSKLITAGDLPGINTWSLTTGELIYAYEGEEAHCTALTVIPKTQRMAVTTVDANIFVWDLNEHSIYKHFHRTKDSVVRVILATPNGSQLVVLTDINEIEIWGIENRSLWRTIKTKSSSLSTMVMTADGKYVITSGAYDETKTWDLKTGHYVSSIEKAKRGVSSLAIANDRLILAGRRTEITIFDLKSSVALRNVGNRKLNTRSVAISGDGSSLAVVGDHGFSLMTIGGAGVVGSAGTCGRGSYWDPLSGGCLVACPAGLYQDSLHGLCAPYCPRGYFGDNSSGLCVSKCGQGSYGEQLSSKCIPTCPDRTWVLKTGDQLQCVAKCPEPMFASMSDKTCVNKCEEGTLLSLDDRTCRLDCTDGSMQDPHGEMCVTSCPEGSATYKLSYKCETSEWCARTNEPEVCMETCGKLFSSSLRFTYSMILIGIALTLIFIGYYVSTLWQITQVSAPSISLGREKSTLWWVLIFLPTLDMATTLLYFLVDHFPLAFVRYIGFFIILYGPTLKLFTEREEKKYSGSYISQWIQALGTPELVNGLPVEGKESKAPRGEELARKATKTLFRHWLKVSFPQLLCLLIHCGLVGSYRGWLFWPCILPSVAMYVIIVYPYICPLLVTRSKFWKKGDGAFPHLAVFTFRDFCVWIKHSGKEGLFASAKLAAA
eukprot:CAMPEP_0115045392 /NCGR_PEP_ID=MMETSP0216-20121206/48126_1 /TAXON_ID=223996 /ORGANISM="Protocruzia adherens, Strain Boccale" /LENGTH=1099 /DNA_ID=CAMNT_0002428273 /DNA_START=26 /DNA_END=3325 /DNA_ORIENTATION=-